MNITTRVFWAVMITAFSQSSAQIVPISIHSTLAVEGNTYVPPVYGGARDDYSITHTFSDNVTSFSDSVSGEASASFAFIPPGVEPMVTQLYASSRASQSITVGENAISMTLRTDTQTSYFSGLAAPFSHAQSDAAVNFRLNEPTNFTFSGYFFFWGPLLMYSGFPGGVGVTLVSSAGEHVFEYRNGPSSYRFDYPPPHTDLPIPYGILQPGEYTLTAQLRAMGGFDPMHTEFGATSFGLSVTPVPDLLPTALLLGVSLAALGLYRSMAGPHSARPTHLRDVAG